MHNNILYRIKMKITEGYKPPAKGRKYTMIYYLSTNKNFSVSFDTFEVETTKKILSKLKQQEEMF